MSTATMSTPARSIQQRLDALGVANDTRQRRAQLKRDLKESAGRTAAGRYARTPVPELAAVLTDPPEYVLTMKLWDLLIAMPKLGRVKVNLILTRARVSPSKTIGGLSERQRAEIVRLLRTGGWR